MTKKKATKAEAVETAHPDVVETAEEVKKVKAVKVETPEEREARLERAREEREKRKEEEEWREMMAPARRKAAAKALWQMYHNGELIRQTIEYHSEIGEINQEVLFSHKSRYAV